VRAKFRRVKGLLRGIVIRARGHTSCAARKLGRVFALFLSYRSLFSLPHILSAFVSRRIDNDNKGKINGTIVEKVIFPVSHGHKYFLAMYSFIICIYRARFSASCLLRQFVLRNHICRAYCEDNYINNDNNDMQTVGRMLYEKIALYSCKHFANA